MRQSVLLTGLNSTSFEEITLPALDNVMSVFIRDGIPVDVPTRFDGFQSVGEYSHILATNPYFIDPRSVSTHLHSVDFLRTMDPDGILMDVRDTHGLLHVGTNKVLHLKHFGDDLCAFLSSNIVSAHLPCIFP